MTNMRGTCRTQYTPHPSRPPSAKLHTSVGMCGEKFMFSIAENMSSSVVWSGRVGWSMAVLQSEHYRQPAIGNRSTTCRHLDQAPHSIHGSDFETCPRLCTRPNSCFRDLHKNPRPCHPCP